MVVFADLFRGAVDIAALTYMLLGDFDIRILYGIVLVFSSLEVFFAPAFTTLLPSVVAKEELTDAIAIKSTVGRLVSIGSPLIAAALLNGFGFAVVLLVDGVTYLLSGLSEIFIDMPPLKVRSKSGSVAGDMAEGLKALMNNKTRAVFINKVLTNIFIIPFVFIGFPFMIVEILNGTLYDFGMVQSAGVIGGLLSIVAVSSIKSRGKSDRGTTIGLVLVIASSASLVLLAIDGFANAIKSDSVRIVLFFGSVYFVFRLANAVYNVFYSALYMTTIPSEIHGRYVALQNLFVTLGRLLGLNLFGYLFDHADLKVTILILGIGIVLKIAVHILFVKDCNEADEKIHIIE